MTDDQRPPGDTGDPPEGGAALDEVDCEDCARNLYEYLDGELEPRLYEQIRHHLEMCRRCYPVFNFERAFLDYVHDRGVKPQRSQELAGRLSTLLDEIDAEES
jgi:anti-sigma factor (TIGR02949 family)